MPASSQNDWDIINVFDNLYISNEETAFNESLLNSVGITHAINLVAHHKNQKRIKTLSYFEANLKDSPSWNILGTLEDVINFISQNDHKNSDNKYLFFWKKGLSRSVSILAGFIMAKYIKTLKETLIIIKMSKPTIDPNIGFLGQLKSFEELNFSTSNLPERNWSDSNE